MTDVPGESQKTDPAVSLVYPSVISASRATDLPAFHAAWLMERLRLGYCEWQNPFNARQRQIVNFSRVKAIIFWSKNPAPLIPYLDEIAASGRKFYFQFTLNNYEAEGLEPGIPPLGKRIETFSQLARRYRVIWRYDPVVIGDNLTVTCHLQIVANLLERIGHLPTRLVFSFIDFYRRTKSSLRRINSSYRPPEPDEMREFSAGMAELRAKLAPELELATCAESAIDFQSFGIQKNSCIDPCLINQLCAEEVYQQKPALCGRAFEKDKGQRKDCGCAPAKDIGSYRSQPCRHGCRYCYAGHAKK